MGRFDNVDLGTRETLKRLVKASQRHAGDVFHFWYVRDDFANRYRTGRSGWPNDTFEMLTDEEFYKLKDTATRFGIQVKNLDEEES